MAALFRISFIILLAGCTPRGEISLLPEAASIGQLRNIFIGTTRELNTAGRFTGKRSADVSYHRYQISVPPLHKTGQIDWPAGKPNPEKSFYTTKINHYPSGGSFVSELSKSLKQRPRNKREVVIFIHGYNNTFAEGLYRFAQLSNDLELPNPTVHYSWPSAGNALGYGYDRDSLLFARDGLEKLISNVKAAGASKVLLVGHSLGSLLTMETLRQMAISNPTGFSRNISGVILISPDIDIDLFHQQAKRIGKLPQPFVIFKSTKDRALQLSARLSGKHARLGNVASAESLSDLKVTILEISQFSNSASGHFTAATSPALLSIIKQLQKIRSAFRNDQSGKAGVLPGAILTVRKAKEIVLSPAH